MRRACARLSTQHSTFNIQHSRSPGRAGGCMKRLLVALAAAAASIVFLAACGAAFGHDPRELLSILAGGSIGSRFALEGTLLKSVPLLLTGLSVAIAFRAGVWNIGAEGQFITGALAAFVAAPYGVVAAIFACPIPGPRWACMAPA